MWNPFKPVIARETLEQPEFRSETISEEKEEPIEHVDMNRVSEEQFFEAERALLAARNAETFALMNEEMKRLWDEGAAIVEVSLYYVGDAAPNKITARYKCFPYMGRVEKFARYREYEGAVKDKRSRGTNIGAECYYIHGLSAVVAAKRNIVGLITSGATFGDLTFYPKGLVASTVKVIETVPMETEFVPVEDNQEFWVTQARKNDKSDDLEIVYIEGSLRHG